MYASLPLPELVRQATTLYTNARDNAEVAALLADPYEYGADDYAHGLALVEEVQHLNAEQQREYGEQYTATATADTLLEDLEALYVAHRRLARTRHRRGTPAYAALGLAGGVADSRAGLLAETDAFYRMLGENATLTEGIRGLGASAVARGRALVEDARTAVNAQAREVGEAQRATRLRDDAVHRLRTHAAELAEVARIALADRPQLIEVLGLPDRT